MFWHVSITHILKIQKFSLGMLSFKQKIFPLLYPPLENSTTCTTIIKAFIALWNLFSLFSSKRWAWQHWWTFLSKNLLNFVSPAWKLKNLYYHNKGLYCNLKSVSFFSSKRWEWQYCWTFLSKNLLNFVSPAWKLKNLYYHNKGLHCNLKSVFSFQFKTRGMAVLLDNKTHFVVVDP